MSPVRGTILDGRVARAREALAGRALDGLVVTSLANVQYLTGFRGTAGVVLLTQSDVRLIVDTRYIAVARALVADGAAPTTVRVIPVDQSYDETLGGALRELSPARLGIEAEHVSVARYNWLAGRLDLHASGGEAPPGSRSSPAGLTLVPVERCIERLRACKDAHEIATLRTAGRMLADVARVVLPQARAGLTERRVANLIDAALQHAGFERPAFETIVASGPHGGFPHARPSDRKLASGDLVVLDFGGVHDGYCVDLTRTVAIGRVDAAAARWYAAVLEANQAAIAAVGPGVRAGAIDRAARQVLEAHGLGEAFGHGTGHGLGLEVHEAPRISRPGASVPDDEVTVGMVFTIEPGVYLEGRGGVRIEDDIVVTPSGCDVLTDVDRTLLVNS